MNQEEKPKEQPDEIGNELETESEVNSAIERQGADATAGIPRDTDAAKQEERKNADQQDLPGAP